MLHADVPSMLIRVRVRVRVMVMNIHIYIISIIASFDSVRWTVIIILFDTWDGNIFVSVWFKKKYNGVSWNWLFCLLLFCFDKYDSNYVIRSGSNWGSGKGHINLSPETGCFVCCCFVLISMIVTMLLDLVVTGVLM